MASDLPLVSPSPAAAPRVAGRPSRFGRIGLWTSYLLVFVLGAGAARFYDASHDVALLHGQVEAAWSGVARAYGQRPNAIPTLVAVLKAAGGVNTGDLEAAMAVLAKIPVPAEPPEREAFRHWEQAEVNVSVALADMFRSIAAAPGLQHNGDYAIALSRLEGTESAIDTAAARYGHAVSTYENGTAHGLPARISAARYPDAAQWEGFTAFPDYGPLDGKSADPD